MKFSKKSVAKMLDEANLEYQTDVEVNGEKFDFLVGDHLLLDVLPLSKTIFDEENGTLADKKRYIAMSNALEGSEYECLHWFEHFDEQKVVEFIASKVAPEKRLYARKCSVKDVDPTEAKRFIDDNHILGMHQRAKVNIGLYSGGELVSCMAFAPVKQTKANQKLLGMDDISNCWELVRFCSKSGYSIVGGASRIFKAFVQQCHPDKVMTYADYDLGNGSVYPTLGFELAKKPGVNCFWSHPKDPKEFINDNLVRIGTDRLLPKYQEKFDFEFFALGMDYDAFVKNGGLKRFGAWWEEKHGKKMSREDWMGNVDAMLYNGFVRCYDAGYSTFVWHGEEAEEGSES